MKVFMWKRFLLDAAIGGMLIAIVVLIAGMLGAVFGGVIVALPIRTGVSILLIKYYFGEAAAIDAARGALFGIMGAVVFVVALNLLLLRFKVIPSTLIAVIPCIITTYALYTIFGGG